MASCSSSKSSAAPRSRSKCDHASLRDIQRRNPQYSVSRRSLLRSRIRISPSLLSPTSRMTFRVIFFTRLRLEPPRLEPPRPAPPFPPSRRRRLAPSRSFVVRRMLPPPRDSRKRAVRSCSSNAEERSARRPLESQPTMVGYCTRPFCFGSSETATHSLSVPVSGYTRVSSIIE